MQRSSTTTTTTPRESRGEDSGGGGASLALSVARDMKLIATVRRFVGELCVRVIGDSNVSARVVIATHELLDNAVRHGQSATANNGAADGDHARIQVVVRRIDEANEQARAATQAHVTIDTTNRIASAKVADDLDRILQTMGAHNDGERRVAFYRELLQRASQGHERSGDLGLGLGLGRVHAESEMNLSSRFTSAADGIVLLHVRAEGLFPIVLPVVGGGARP